MLNVGSKVYCSSFFLICLAAMACGCSKSSKFDLAPVAGTVTLDGQPLADADVTFFYQGSSAPGYRISTGKTDPAGKYELKAGAKPGAVPGDFKVTVSRIVSKDGATVNLDEGMDMTQLEMQGLAKQSLPEKYSDYEKTELSAKVEKGKSDGYDFPLAGS